MREWVQIGFISAIVFLMMFALACILDNPDNKEARKGLVKWAFVAALLIGQAIW